MSNRDDFRYFECLNGIQIEERTQYENRDNFWILSTFVNTEEEAIKYIRDKREAHRKLEDQYKYVDRQ